ncbi:MAG TPA: AAA family ATPase [Actinomycetota bacterium]
MGILGSEASTATLTFVIADVRGYTRFTRERGDAAAATLAKKFADLSRDAVEARGGRVLELRGDEALAVFESPAQAVRAALEFQATCAEESRSDPDLPLPVGIGIDSGEAVPVEEGYRGRALNMAARLCSGAAAGEVLVTRGVADEADLSPAEAIFAERGPRSFKGFEHDVDVIEASFEQPPITDPLPERRPEAATLPPELDPLTPLVDREHEMRWLRGTWRSVRRGRGRVLFVSGPAQIGKTRLAAEIAAHVRAGGGSVRYAGPGGAGTAMALAALREASTSTLPTLLVLDDIDVAGPQVADAIAKARPDAEGRPLMILGFLRSVDASPALADLVHAVDERGDGHRALSPLDADGVRDIVRLYVGDAVPDVPLESMVRSSEGVPGRVHEVASDWARSEATRRLEAAAEYLAAGRRLRATDLEFANNVIGLKLGRLYSVEGRNPRRELGDLCPYKGLASFEENDWASFFGRERLVGELAARTVQVGVLGVVGASGSGKSSLVAAGLLPSLGAGLLPGSDRWIHAVMRPGDRPMAALASALVVVDRSIEDADDPLAAAVSTIEQPARIVLVVDQFEEAFTMCESEAERARFIASLAATGHTSPDRCVVVLTIRSDYYGHIAPYPDLAEILAENHVLIGPMSRDELRRAIELPGRRVGLRVEEALVDALVEEVADEPGGLPLLSTALVELWQARQDGWIRMDAHERTGGVKGAVARLAETAYGQLTGVERDAVRRIMLRLVVSDGETVARRRAFLDEFDPARDAVAQRVIMQLARDRLLTLGDGTVEIAHEALLREWPRLRRWLEEDQQGRQVRQQLGDAARHWGSGGRDASELFRGARLSATLDWASTHPGELNELERDFIADSRRASEHEAERQRRTNRRLRGLLAGVAAFLVIALVAGALALVQRASAQREATRAEAQRLGAQALVADDLDLSLLLAREGVNLDDSLATRSNLLAALLRSPAAIGIARPLPGRLLRVHAIPGTASVVVSNNADEFAVVDTTTRTVTDRFTSAFATVSADGTRIGLVDPDGAVRIREVGSADTQTVGKLPTAAVQFFTIEPTFTPDLAKVVAGYFPGPGEPSRMELFDATTLRSVGRRGSPDGLSFANAIVSSDGRYVATTMSEGEFGEPVSSIYVWRTEDLSAPVRLIRTEDPAGFAAAFSHDGRSLAIGLVDGSVGIVDLRTGRQRVMNGRHNAAIQGLAFSPDDATLVSAGDDEQILVWDVPTGALRETLTGHNGRVLTPAFSADGRTLSTVSLDGTLMMWDLSGTRRLGRSFPASEGVEGPIQTYLAVAPDGERLAIPSAGGGVVIRDAASLDTVRTIRTGTGDVLTAAFSPDGELLATETHLFATEPGGADRYRVALWDARSGEPLADLTGPPLEVELGPDEAFPNDVEALAFSPDGTLLAGGDDAGHVYLWDAASHRVVGDPIEVPPDPQVEINGVLGVAFSHDGSMLAAAHGQNASVWRLPERELLFTVNVDEGYGRSKAVAFSADDRILATGGGTGVVRFWEAATGAADGGASGHAVPANACWIESLEFSPDGRTLLTSGCDGSARLFDASSRQEIGSPLQGPGNESNSAVFSPDGSRIFVAYRSGIGFVWNVTLGAWKEQACTVAGRNLTRAEWERYLPERPYELVCPGIPSAGA